MVDGAFRILVSDTLAPEGLRILEAASLRVSFDVKGGLSPEAQEAIIGDYDALAVRSATQVTRALITAGRRLKVIGRAGIGVDNIDVGAASARGIVVMNTPDGNAVSTAEHTLALLFSLARKIPQATASMRQGRWEKSRLQGRELAGQTLGIVGLGRVGTNVASRALGLRMKVVVSDPYVTAARAEALGVELLDLETLLLRSDVVSLHVPLANETRNIIDASALARMKDGACLINAARGGLVDEHAVAEALRSGKLGGAAFDVFLEEPPPPSHPFLEFDNVILTPHLGASTDEAQVQVSIALAEQILDFLLRGIRRNVVNSAEVPVGAVDARS